MGMWDRTAAKVVPMTFTGDPAEPGAAFYAQIEALGDGVAREAARIRPIDAERDTLAGRVKALDAEIVRDNEEIERLTVLRDQRLVMRAGAEANLAALDAYQPAELPAYEQTR